MYTGATAVEEGVLYIIEGYTPTLAVGTAQVVSDKSGYNKFIPGTVATDGTLLVVAENEAAAAAMGAVSLTAAQTEAGVLSSYYKVVASETETAGVYALEIVFADAVVPVVSGEELSSDGGTVTFSISNFKKGLYYGVATATDADDIDESTATLTQATDDSGTGVTSLGAAMPTTHAPVKYYKVVVSDAATVE